jgi:hypothetical protein
MLQASDYEEGDQIEIGNVQANKVKLFAFYGNDDILRISSWKQLIISKTYHFDASTAVFIAAHFQDDGGSFQFSSKRVDRYSVPYPNDGLEWHWVNPLTEES